jgi:hypothetical protein
MLTRVLHRSRFLFSKIKVDEIKEKSYEELVDLVAKRYVSTKRVREIDSSSTQTLLLSFRYSITSASSTRETGFLT